MARWIVILILCFIFLAGCAQTLKQHSNMLSAINGKLTPVSYNKAYALNTFGYPDSKTTSVKYSVTTEVWTYKTNMGGKDLILNTRPWQARYMKITIRNDIVTDVSFEG